MQPTALFLFVFIYQFSFGQQNIEITSPGSDSNNLKVTHNEEKKISSDSSRIYSIVENMPVFPDSGDIGFTRYIAANFKYPRKERRNNIQGTVFVSFVICADGKITDAKIMKGVSEGLDKEAIRVVSSSPKWNPGKQSGKDVCVYYRVPIRCTLK